MNRFERLLEDILISENDVLRQRYHLMTPSATATALVQPQRDTLGDWFLGFGTSILHGVKVHSESADITMRHAFECAASEVYGCLCHAPDLVENWGVISNIRQDVLAQMVYQLGYRGVSKFKKMIAAINAVDYEEAALQMLDSKWARQVPNRAAKLAERMRRNIWISIN